MTRCGSRSASWRSARSPSEEIDAIARSSSRASRRAASSCAARTVLCELAGRVLLQSRRLVLERALQPFDLAALDVGEARLDPRRRLRLLAVDPLQELPLAGAEPVGDLLQRLAALRADVLEVRGRGVDRLLRGALRLVAEAEDRRLVLAGLDADLLDLLPDAAVDVLELLPEPLLDARGGAGEVVLDPLEVLRPLAQPLLDALLHLVEADRVLGRGAALLLLELLAALLREPPCLLGEDAAELGAHDGQRAPKLLRALLVLLLDQRREPGALFREVLLGVGALSPHAVDRSQAARRIASPTARQTTAAAIACSASSAPRISAARAASSTSGSVRRTARIGVDRRRWATIRRTPNAATKSASQVISSAAAKYAARIGVAPHETASCQSPWKRPPKELEVVRDDHEPADRDEEQEPRRPGDRRDDADRHRAGQRADAERPEHAGGDLAS